MKIKLDKFCALATSSSWQAWLYSFNESIYTDFITRLRKSTGCANNSTIMVDILDKIKSVNGSDELLKFVKSNFPYMVVDEPVVIPSQVFDGYDPSILTYPRRLILRGDGLIEKINDFLRGKIKSDFVIVDNVAYIEYLIGSDIALVDKIPLSNWKVTNWKSINQRSK